MASVERSRCDKVLAPGKFEFHLFIMLSLKSIMKSVKEDK